MHVLGKGVGECAGGRQARLENHESAEEPEGAKRSGRRGLEVRAQGAQDMWYLGGNEHIAWMDL